MYGLDNLRLCPPLQFLLIMDHLVFVFLKLCLSGLYARSPPPGPRRSFVASSIVIVVFVVVAEKSQMLFSQIFPTCVSRIVQEGY